MTGTKWEIFCLITFSPVYILAKKRGEFQWKLQTIQKIGNCGIIHFHFFLIDVRQ
jgi:hypothetical protein